jgi:hypothetical protein
MRQLTTRFLCAAPALVVLAAFAAPRSASELATPAGPGGVIHMVKKHFAALDRGDVEAALDLVAAPGETHFPITWYDVGTDCQPLNLSGREAVAKALAEQCAQNKAGGWTTTKIADDVHADCHSPQLGYATLTLERKAEGQPSQRLRMTALGCYVSEKNAWRWFHLHVSPVAMPLQQVAK